MASKYFNRSKESEKNLDSRSFGLFWSLCYRLFSKSARLFYFSLGGIRGIQNALWRCLFALFPLLAAYSEPWQTDNN